MPNSYRVGGPSGRSNRVHGSLVGIHGKSAVNGPHRNSSIQPVTSTSTATFATTSGNTMTTAALQHEFSDMPLLDTSDFCHLMLRTLVSRMVARATPFTHLTSTSTQVLAELLALKLGQLAKTVKLATEMAGRTQATLQDVAIALDRVGTGHAGCNADSEAGYGGAIDRDQGELRRWCLSEAETSVKAIGGNAVTVLHQLVQSGRVPPAPPYLIYEYKSDDENDMTSMSMSEEDEESDTESADINMDIDTPVTLTVDDNVSDQSLPSYIPRHLPPLPSYDTAIESSTHTSSNTATNTSNAAVSTTTSIQTTEPSQSNIKATAPDITHQTTPKSKRKRSRHPNAEQADQLALAALHSNDTATFMARTIFNPSSMNTKHQFLAYEVPDTNIDDFMHISYPGIFATDDKPRVSVKHIKQPAPPPPGSTVKGPQLSLLTTKKHINAAPMDTLFGPCELGKVPSVSDTVQHLMQPAILERIVTNNHTIRGRALPPPSATTSTTSTSAAAATSSSGTSLIAKIPAISSSTSTAANVIPTTPTPISIKVKSAQLSKKLAEAAAEDKSTKATTLSSNKPAPSIVSVVLPSKSTPTPTPSSSSSKVPVEKSRDTSDKLAISTTTTTTTTTHPATSTPLSPIIKLKSPLSSSTTSDTHSTTTTSMAAPSTPSTPSTPLPKIRLKIGKLSIGLPQTSPSTSTSTSVSSLSKPSIPTVTAAPLLDTNVMTSNEPEEIINCICDAPTIDHGRFMIACDQCATWFHGECVHVGPDTVPDGTEWYCPRCSTTKQS